MYISPTMSAEVKDMYSYTNTPDQGCQSIICLLHLIGDELPRWDLSLLEKDAPCPLGLEYVRFTTHICTSGALTRRHLPAAILGGLCSQHSLSLMTMNEIENWLGKADVAFWKLDQPYSKQGLCYSSSSSYVATFSTMTSAEWTWWC